jgi:lysophospholipase L1-like esterase
VTLGESVTDGVGSTPDTNQRWTNVLAERLQRHWWIEDIAVLNAGIAGNRILHDIVGPSGLSRLDRDVLVQSGAT